MFGPGILLGFVGSPRDFEGFCFLPPFDHSQHLKSEVPPPPPGHMFGLLVRFIVIDTLNPSLCGIFSRSKCRIIFLFSDGQINVILIHTVIPLTLLASGARISKVPITFRTLKAFLCARCLH